MEATKFLKEQHQEVKQLFQQFGEASESKEKQSLFEQIADDLAAHAEIEEKIFYPAVYVGELKEELREAVQEHLGAKRLIADLLELNVEDKQFDAKMKVLEEQIEHHVQEEEGELFPKVRKNFEAAELEALGEEMKIMFDEVREDNPRQKVPQQTAQAAPLE